MDKKKILIVDDDPDIRTLVKSYLSKSDYDVAEARDGFTGMGKVAENAPDLVLLDINMPGMDGLEVCKKLRSDPKNIFAIIMLTADEESEVAGLESGADDYIVKPFRRGGLLARIKRGLATASHRKDANVDPLTGIFNRRTFSNFLAQEEERALRYSRPLSAIMVDIDHFKNVNDTYGHDVGDLVLVELAKILRHTCRESDLLARLGGEEFGILLPETIGSDAIIFAERARVRIVEHSFPNIGRLTASFGLAELKKEDEIGMMKRADKALYRAKQSGRNKVVIHQSGAEDEPPMALLVVDDDRALQDLVKIKMMTRGYDVLTADDGVTAFRILRERRVDLVLLDQDMPGRDGTHVFLGIKNGWPDLPVVMVTAYSSKHLIKDFLLAGGRDFIEKPIIDFEAFDFRIRRVLQEVVREKEAQQELRDAIVREESQNAKNVFLAAMSHEIRTPLNSVKGMVYMLEKSGLSDQQNEHVAKISKAVGSLMVLVDNILDFSAVEVGDFVLEDKTFNLEEMLRGVCLKCSERFVRKGLYLRIDVDVDVPLYLVGDIRSLEQVFVLLLDNGVKFTEHGGVEVSVTLLEMEGQRLVLSFVIRDTGVGMTNEECKGIFSPFFQADGSISRSYGGIGLGLALSKKLVAFMQGKISVESTPGKGSVFRFTVVCESAVRQGDSDVLSRDEKIVINLPVEAEQKAGSETDITGKDQVKKVPWNRDVGLPLLRSLDDLLNGHDTQSGQFLKSFIAQGYPAEIEEELRQLEKAVSDYDFEHSQELLTTILQKV